MPSRSLQRIGCAGGRSASSPVAVEGSSGHAVCGSCGADCYDCAAAAASARHAAGGAQQTTANLWQQQPPNANDFFLSALFAAAVATSGGSSRSTTTIHLHPLPSPSPPLPTSCVAFCSHSRCRCIAASRAPPTVSVGRSATFRCLQPLRCRALLSSLTCVSVSPPVVLALTGHFGPAGTACVHEWMPLSGPPPSLWRADRPWIATHCAHAAHAP